MDARRQPAERPGAKCPECGQLVAPNKRSGHAELHWPRETAPQHLSPEAARRKQMVLDGQEE